MIYIHKKELKLNYCGAHNKSQCLELTHKIDTANFRGRRHIIKPRNVFVLISLIFPFNLD